MAQADGNWRQEYELKYTGYFIGWSQLTQNSACRKGNAFASNKIKANGFGKTLFFSLPLSDAWTKLTIWIYLTCITAVGIRFFRMPQTSPAYAWHICGLDNVTLKISCVVLLYFRGTEIKGKRTLVKRLIARREQLDKEGEERGGKEILRRGVEQNPLGREGHIGTLMQSLA